MKISRIKGSHSKVKETLISICEILVLCIFCKYAQHTQAHVEQPSKEEDTVQKFIQQEQLVFRSLGVDAVYVGYNIIRMSL